MSDDYQMPVFVMFRLQERAYIAKLLSPNDFEVTAVDALRDSPFVRPDTVLRHLKTEKLDFKRPVRHLDFQPVRKFPIVKSEKRVVLSHRRPGYRITDHHPPHIGSPLRAWVSYNHLKMD